MNTWRIQPRIAGFPRYLAGVGCRSSLEWYYLTWAGRHYPIDYNAQWRKV